MVAGQTHRHRHRSDPHRQWRRHRRRRRPVRRHHVRRHHEAAQHERTRRRPGQLGARLRRRTRRLAGRRGQQPGLDRAGRARHPILVRARHQRRLPGGGRQPARRREPVLRHAREQRRGHVGRAVHSAVLLRSRQWRGGRSVHSHDSPHSYRAGRGVCGVQLRVFGAAVHRQHLQRVPGGENRHCGQSAGRCYVRALPSRGHGGSCGL